MSKRARASAMAMLAAGTLIGGTLSAAVVAALHGSPEEDFPHAEHARVFPLCVGCHDGIPEGDSANAYPPPTVCLRCHDGVEEESVEWEGPHPDPSNLLFDHVVHAREMGDEAEALECEGCHVADTAAWLSVQLAVVEQCLACHAHRATEHFVDADCGTCHVPLASSTLPAELIAAIPTPPDHTRPDYLEGVHGEQARVSILECAVCHTRESCADCHVNAAVIEPINAIPAAPPAMTVPRRPARYPVPTSHLERAFIERHGETASASSCGACHTRNDCAACHQPPAARAIADLPSRAEVVAPGAGIVRRAPASHASPSFPVAHGTFAAASPASCTTCHARTECESCHSQAIAGGNGAGGLSPMGVTAPANADSAQDGPRRETLRARPDARHETASRVAAAARSRSLRPEAVYHPPDFALRHSSAGYGRRLECSTCHETRAFCADCHRQAGMSASGRLGPAFHDAEPLWLLRHPQAARQALESCASCHRQRDCMQCHSTTGAFRVSPHGPGFDPRRAQKRNAAACQLCHLGNPLER